MVTSKIMDKHLARYLFMKHSFPDRLFQTGGIVAGKQKKKHLAVTNCKRAFV